MANGRLASGSIAAGGATKLYRNTTGNAQVVTLLASSQVSGKTPKLNVKITNENFTENSSQTNVISGTNHTLAAVYPSLSSQIVGSSNYANSDVTDSGSRLHLSIGQKETSDSMGQAWSKSSTTNPSSTSNHPWSKVSFGGQPMGVGGSQGGSYSYSNVSTSLSRSHMPCYDPYYFENPNAFNQNKARGVVPGYYANTIYHIEDISKMSKTTLKTYHTYNNGAGALYSEAAPSTHASTYGTVTSRTVPSSYANRGYVYDIYTGLFWGWQSAGYTSYMYMAESGEYLPAQTTNGWNYGNASSNSGVWRWSNGNWTGSDPQSYDTHGHGTPYGCYADCANGLIVAHAGEYSNWLGFKFYDKFFVDGTMMDKDNRAPSQHLETFSRSSYYHTINYSGSASYLKLQWVAYNPGTAKYYVCFWDNSGSYNANPVPTMGTSYATESGIFEVDVTKIRGKDQTLGNTYHEYPSTWKTDGTLTKVGSVPDTVSGLMSKPMRLADSLWTAHCQDGTQYFSTNLYTWGVKSSTYIPDAYQMVNASKLGDAGATENSYYVAAGSTSVVYSYSSTTVADLYDQAAIAGIIAKGAVTPYEQKSIILSNGDAIYVENEDTTNGISVTAMGVDV